MSWLDQRQYRAGTIILAAAAWMVLLCNFTFFSHVLDVYPLFSGNIGFVVSLALLLTALTVFMLASIAVGRALKVVLIAMLLTASATAYFMDTYNVIVSTELIESTLQTDSSESMGLLNLKLVLYLGLLGILPAVVIFRVRVQKRPFRTALVSRLKLLGASLLVLVAVLGVFNSAYASFFRAHKSVRFYSNPVTPVYAAIKYVKDKLGDNSSLPHQVIGQDAKMVAYSGKRRLVLLVVGETAREDRFSLNGYRRETNPVLEKDGVISFDNVWSCGTATAISVPCMFSALDRSNYSERQAKSTDNVLDIVQRAGVNVAWLDNNSDSKGVALRIPYTSYRDSAVNPDCDTECRDEGMLAGVRKFVDAHPDGDILIVLHQMGSHGPEYAKRYPKKFEHFSPSCQSNLLEDCSQQEINNAYDNSIRYTDYFLGKVIDYLKAEETDFSPAMLYLSDHGESLGESGIYLHGFPYALAPDEQKHVPMVFWSGDGFTREKDRLAEKGFTHREFSQDNLFHTLLGLMRVETSVYQPKLDIFANG